MSLLSRIRLRYRASREVAVSSKIVSRVFRLLRVLGSAWPVALGLGVPVAGWLWLPALYPDAAVIRYFGVSLELVGVIVLAYELVEVQEQFNSPGMFKIARQWMRDLANVFAPDRTSSDDPGAADAAVTMAGFNERRRVDDLIDNMRRRLDILLHLDQQLDDIQHESNSASNKVQELEQQIHCLYLGNVGREFVGVCLLCFGLVLSNLQDELFLLWTVFQS